VRCVEEDGGDQIISLEQTTSEQDGTTQPCGETSVRGIAIHTRGDGRRHSFLCLPQGAWLLLHISCLTLYQPFVHFNNPDV
jgi:hypothetical protein